MRKFKVLGGKHAFRGPDGVLKVYKKDEVIETDEDLEKKYTNHFVEVHYTTPASAPTPVAAEKAKEETKPAPGPAADDPPKGDGRPNVPDFGDDVTAEFKDAVKADLKVFKSDKGYTVTNEDDPEVSVSGEPLSTKKDVHQFIKTYSA